MRKLAILLLVLPLAACSSSNGAPVQPAAVDFQQFVQEQIAATANDSDPVELNAIDFLNQDAANPGFGNLLN